jgi:uncharacterized protein YbcC (UPF0753/DUF2309 family)
MSKHATIAAADLPSDLAVLKGKLEHAAHLLPQQGPIGVFIHHNTLHAFEHQTFEEGVLSGSAVFGCEPYLPEDRYRDELARGRILSSDLRAVLERDLGPRAGRSLLGLSTLLEMRLGQLEHPLRLGSRTELEWFMAQTDALRRTRPDVAEVTRKQLINETRHWVMRRLRASVPDGEHPAWIGELFTRFGERRIEDWSEAQWEAFTLSALWEVCEAGARLSPFAPTQAAPTIRHRDLLHAVTGVDSDLMVNDVLIRVCSSFLDQGIAHWAMPEREGGLYQSFCALYAKGGGASVWWAGALAREVQSLRAGKVDALASIQLSLENLGVAPEEHEAFLSATLLALRGWGGMVWHVENRPDRVHHAIPEGSLIDFVAVRLVLERLALRAAAADALGYEGDLAGLRDFLRARAPEPPAASEWRRAYLLFQLAQVLGWAPEKLFHLSPEQWETLVSEVERFDELDRRRVFHLAYEHRFRVQILDALAVHLAAGGEPPQTERPPFQAVFCLDEREESIRRHVEEIAPKARTFAAAGFFGVAMYYRGAAHADFAPLCPVVVRPQHWISERVDPALEVEAKRRAGLRRRIGMALQSYHGGSRRMGGGALLSTTLGLLATIPLVARVVFPRLTYRFQHYLGGFVAPPPATRLVVKRAQPASSPEDPGHGYLPEEMIAICERQLRDIGLTANFARLVFICGHGSTSMNNPHESAHDCGACGGGPGGANARALAQMLNDPLVRQALAGRGLAIPDDTVFIGGMHNTANDDITLSDTDLCPDSHRAEFKAYAAQLHEAGARNAHERARRFGSAPLSLSPPGAKRHMEGRVQDLSQVRPEWGHATNAVCIVGRRDKTRGMFLDRRAFLISYDPSQDDEVCTILGRILGAAVPVCSGINLEYYFSNVDSPGWGSGSKLPHNITGLIGVMDGAMSDLRTGLPWQMVEIHEPMRLLFILEQSEAAIEGILAQNAFFKNMLQNRWIQLAAMDPETGALSVYRDGGFEPHVSKAEPLPTAQNSQEWYTGWRDYLQFAEIVPATARR